MTTLNICAYCSSMGDDSEKQVSEWKETGELVCFDCRVEFLEKEFVEGSESSKGIPADIKEKIEYGIPF